MVVKRQDDAVRDHNAKLQRIECARKQDEERLRRAEEIRRDLDAKGEGLRGSEAVWGPDLEPLNVKDMIQHRRKRPSQNWQKWPENALRTKTG
jgi:hypothetical protein